MRPYRNVMELLVEQQLDAMAPALHCCLCPICRNDMIAYALNQLPPHYVVSDQGELYLKAMALDSQPATDLITAITLAVRVVSANPRHPAQPPLSPPQTAFASDPPPIV